MNRRKVFLYQEKRFKNLLICSVFSKKQDAHFQNTIPLKKHVTVAILKLANETSFRTK